MRFMVMRSLALLACGAFSLAQPSLAQTYPTKPVRMVVPFPPGGVNDNIARALSQSLNPVLGQPIVVENRAGANGNIGMEACYRGAPDGYTACLPGGVSFTLNPFAYDKVPYDPNGFTPVVLVGNFEQAVAVHPGLPAKTMRELIDLAKAKPGYLNWASLGTGSTSHLYLEWFRATTGASMVHVPYTGSPAAVQAVLSGQAQAMAITPGIVSQHVAAGKMRVLAMVSRGARAASMPDVPTLGEQGYDLDFRNWVAYWLPPNTPEPIVRRFNGEANKVIADKAFTDKAFAPLSVLPAGGTLEQLAAFMRESAKVGAQLAKMANLKFE
jgi:tripartite-type tricarboxylate transporter receptor subunit TctC